MEHVPGDTQELMPPGAAFSSDKWALMDGHPNFLTFWVGQL